MDMASRGMVVELAMLDPPELTGGDEVAVAHHAELKPALGIRRLQAANACAGPCEHLRSCAAADRLRGFDLSLLAGIAPPIMAHVGAGRWIVRPIAQGAVAVTRA